MAGTNLKRKLFNLAAIVSMVLCIGTGVLWVRSYWLTDSYIFDYRCFRSVDEYCSQSLYLSSVNGIMHCSITRSECDLGYYQKGAQVIKKPAWIDHYRENATQGLTHYYMSYSEKDIEEILAADGFTVPFNNDMESLLYPTFETRSEKKIWGNDQQWTFNLPAPYFILFMTILPLRWFYLKRKESKRLRTGLCKTCGYDLRATPERCPECGTVVVVEAAG